MSASGAVFFLMLVLSGGGPISMSQIGDFKSKAECSAAREAVLKVTGQKSGIQFVCVSDESLEGLEKANR